jgi:vacuolar protein sorting-associated protein 13A/C
MVVKKFQILYEFLIESARWNFAYDCILHTEVRRKRNNWDWNHIKKHRDRCKRYGHAYKEKLEAKKPSADLLKEVADLEKALDVFNIIVLRQRAEVQVIQK